MDKPLGPRQPPPDKRHAAYESIFGRPGVPPPTQPVYHRSSYVPNPRQSYYPNPHTSFPQYVPQYQPYPSSSLQPPPNPALARARSVNSNSPDYSPAPPPPPPPISDHVHAYPGLTPAQAYQAQIYNNSPSHSHSPAPAYGPRPSPAPSNRTSNVPGLPAELPRIGISLEHDDGRLGLDFSASSTTGADVDSEDSSSELPWARSEPSSTRPSAFSFSLIDL